jgi:hypothetical protein|tara:strand:- start:924 stop:1484 length:561 start_codon:yes stop_codon:yes gene_type:complete
MNCSICLKEIKENNKVITDCKHPFHLSCILNNFKINNYSGEKCPICRKSLFTTSMQNNQIGNIVRRYVMAPLRRRTVDNNPSINVLNVPSFIRYNWPPSENTNMSEERYNYQIFTRLKVRKYRNITNVERTMQLTNYAYLIVSKYSYHKLKEKLGLYRLSRRGYRRTALEDRLINHMILDTTGLLV